ncbi:MAG: 4-hydroxy-tetrahydrodipicolinate reductase [Clostridiales bacterium 38_11]|nr:MAG: 4-hydroxy-tetrahydrodipicolinate reductase [Clostridiales bacterium 38_11]
MSLNILLIGCNGAMGRTITSIVSDNDKFNICAGVDRTAIHNQYPIYQNMWDIKESIDVIIDFSSKELLESIMEFAIDRNLPVVLCTTGYDEADYRVIRERALKIPVFNSSNMSYGVNVVLKLLEQAAKLMSEGYDIEIVEKHHNLKKDAPSGTAKMMIKAINGSLEEERNCVYGRSGNDAKRQTDEIGVHSIRGGTIPGEHSVIFAGQDEIIEINHSALSKRVFAEGALKAAIYLNGKRPGLYDMNSMIKSN